MRWVATGGAVLLLLGACGGGSADRGVELAAAGETAVPEESCAPVSCELLEGAVIEVDAGQGHLVVAVDLAWAPDLRTDLGPTRFTLSDATLFLPAQTDLASLLPGEFVVVRSTPDSPAGRHALSVMRVDRD